ncbi:hypothetical protein DFH27DRAFT_515102 [Peziza echinospora]|nr:hypothetical protein DFH27DRAFT_515102 [Peziza echinospora]
MPSVSGRFQTLKREKLFRDPPKDKSAFPALQAAILPHIDSFNALTVDGGLLDLAARDIGERAVFDGKEEFGPFGNKLTIRVEKIYVDKPKRNPRDKTSLNRTIYPSECRERHISYRSRLTVKLGLKINEGEWESYDRDCGALPVMLRSNRCNLEKLAPADLVHRKEESDELGGYFIVNGNEKLIRLLVVQRRNHPMAIIRPSYANRGASYTSFGVQIRSVRPDQTSQTNVLHYLSDGNITFRFSWRKNEFLIPAMMVMKALVETNDREIFDGLVPLSERDNTFLTDRVELLLRTYKVYGLPTKQETLAYIGDKFRVVMMLGPDVTDVEVGKEVLRRIVLVHLSDDRDKFRMMIFMIKKLYSLVKGDCAQDNPDAVQHQEILLGGFLYGQVLKERVEKLVDDIRLQVRTDINRGSKAVSFKSKQYLSGVFAKVNENIGAALEYFLSTGNLSSPSGLDLQQVSGFVVVAEKINFYRFISHFRMVHRGAFFAQLKTTTVRKLLPESWGFLCPVHTPDGSPCGLLNHLAHKCRITTTVIDTAPVRKALSYLGVVSPATSPLPRSATMCVQIDGCIVGWCSPKQAKLVSDTLRFWKVEGTHDIPLDLEIGYVPVSNGGQYPGIYLFGQQARMLRPVKYLPLDKVDQVGPFEQPHMTIACTPQEITSGDTSHVEFDPTNILSIVANMTPFSDFNQSPRNMYQCQMGKQAMGTPGTATIYRTDNKSYRLQTGQTPIVKAPLYDEYGLDNFPNGFNAVVAVISYTGYDMDDAMIINKSSYERGFGYGTVYKTEQLGWKGEKARGESQMRFGFADSEAIEHVLRDAKETAPIPPAPIKKPEADDSLELFEQYEKLKEQYDEEKAEYDQALRRVEKQKKDMLNGLGRVQAKWFDFLDYDGLPKIGAKVEDGDPVAAYYDVSKKEARVFTYHGTETAYIDEVRVLMNESSDQPCQEITVKYRIPRAPQIGDKFASRHGQKGVCSQKWPAADMPFTESGMQPDIIINPHAFPSRMTIGMLVESLAGKSGALHGVTQDSTPFKFDEENTASDYFGNQLLQAGYNYHGNEPMYSGITGTELKADIYIGLVYYQRLRHMVNDKFQVRTTGKISELTHQPIKGRKKGGGIRVGEMERDSMLAHGAAFLLQDRLLNCSDYTQSWICRECGTFMSTTPAIKKPGMKAQVRCRRCASKATGFEDDGETWEDGQGNVFVGGERTTVVAIPYVLKYLDAELSAMGVQMKYNVKH